MNYITRNKGILLSLMFNTLDRKPATNQEDRSNYKELLLDYCNFLHRLSFIDANLLNIKLNKQRSFLDKLDTLTQRYKSIGIDCIPEKSVESFLTNIQDNMKDWIEADYFAYDLLSEETKYFNTASSKLEMSSGAGLERKKSEAVDILMHSSRNRVNF
jgi:hypothetical protein